MQGTPCHFSDNDAVFDQQGDTSHFEVDNVLFQ